MKKAFSLIELSIVILIIGILVAGVTQSSRLIAQMRLASARAMTNSSPIASIRDLVFWFEPTLEESFLTTQAEDGTQISQWNDINPFAVNNKYYAVKTASAQVIYKSNAINGIPGLQFTGANSANGYFTLSTTTVIGGATNIQTTNNRFTIFVVSKLDIISDAINRGLIYNGNASISGWGYYRDTSNKRGILFGGVVADLSTSASSSLNPEIISVVYTGNGATTIPVYVNGIAEAYPSLGSSPATPTSSLFIGGTSNTAENWNGFISEIIVYDRALKTEERQSIERYLGKKYGIRTS